MDLQALFDELAKLSPEARDEIIIALNFDLTLFYSVV